MLVLQHILAMLFKMFSITHILSDGQVKDCMTSTLTRFESSGFLPVGDT
jgi:hypothetical protein